MKPRRYLSLSVSTLVVVSSLISSSYAATLTWDGGVNSNWNASDANWTGSAWNNGTPDSAFFNTNTGTINLTEAINAGSLTFGVNNANYSGVFSGSDLSVTGNLIAVADGNNGPGGPTLSFSNNVTVGGDLSIGRRVVEITGGTFTANRILSTDSWGRLLISGGTVTATNGIDDSINGGNTMNVYLQGGVLYTPYIKTTTVGFTSLPSDGVVLNGGSLYATASTSDFIQSHDPTGGSWGTRNNVGVGTAGANINTNGFNIGINKTLQDFGGAGTLTKSGAGTLTLSASNAYSGGTTVNQGTLVLDGARGGYSRISGALTVNSGASVNFVNDDGTGLGWIDGSKATVLNINEGTVSTAGALHIWNLSGGVNMTGGTLSSNNGSSDPNGAQLEWINSTVTTNASATASTIAGRIRMRSDGGATGVSFNVANGEASSDLLVTAAITEASGGLGITKNGAGTMRLTGYNTYSGGTTVNEGRLEVHGGSGGWGLIRGAVTVNSGATLAITGGDGTGFGWNSPVNSLTINGGTFDAAGGAHMGFGGAMALSMNNGGTISGNGQWNGGDQVSFSSSGDSTNTINGSWNLRTDSGVSHKFNVGDGASSVDLQVNASLNDQYPEVWWLAPADLEKTGAGTMVLAGNNSYNGATTVSAGSLIVNGNITSSATTVKSGATLGGSGSVGSVSVESGATFAPGNSPGTMTFDGDLTLASGSISNFEINAFTSGNFDLARAAEAGTQNVAFAGILNLAFQSGFSTVGAVKIFDFDGYSGTFSSILSSGLASGYTASFDSATGFLTVVPEPSSALLSGLGLLFFMRRRR